jgi:predicted SnoaL-like aldol condensation-catalyzing enzyme
MDIKQFITDYYHALVNPEEVKKFVHPNLRIEWHSVKGFIELDSDEVVRFAQQFGKNYATLRLEITHIIAEGNSVAVRYINYVTTPDDPHETALTQSVAIWELQDNKLYRGYVMSHLE